MTMELTTLEKRIIWHIKQHNGSRDEAAIVIDLLRSEPQQTEMLTFLMTKPTATPMEIVDKAIELYRAAEKRAK